MTDLVNIRRPGDKQSDPATATTPVHAQPAPGSPDLADHNSSAGPKAYVETYGCQMNVADTEMVLGTLSRAGYSRTADPAEADLILINTCAIREKAEERVFGRVGTLAQHKKKRPGVILGVTGCMAEHLKGGISKRAPQVDLVIGPDGYRRLLDNVNQARGGAQVQDTKLDRKETYAGLDPDRQMTGGVTGHISIQRGCDKFCSFCVVPYTRGRERGTPPREVLRQARAMAESGYKEIQLLGQTVNSYRYEDVTFADLLRGVADINGIERIRFTSPYPLDFSSDVIEAMAQNPKICKHVHLPLQSGSSAVLNRMGRGYDYPTYRELVHKLRAAMPDIAITTDLMVGYCGESDSEYEETVAAQEEIRFDNAFTFAYSEREGTKAWKKVPDDISPELKQKRLARIIETQRRITGEKLATQRGTRQKVLIESVSKRNENE